MYRGEPHFREFLVAEQKERLRHADERFVPSMQASEPGLSRVRTRLSDAHAWAAAWRWPHEGGHWQSIHDGGHWHWPHAGGRWQSPHGAGHAH